MILQTSLVEMAEYCNFTSSDIVKITLSEKVVFDAIIILKF